MTPIIELTRILKRDASTPHSSTLMHNKRCLRPLHRPLRDFGIREDADVYIIRCANPDSYEFVSWLGTQWPWPEDVADPRRTNLNAFDEHVIFEPWVANDWRKVQSLC